MFKLISNTMLLISFIIFILLPYPSISTDPDPLQDFCVADLNATVSVSGFPCKPISKVTVEDFFFDGLSKEGNTKNPFGFGLTPGNVLKLPGLNTLGLSMNRIDLAPGGMNPPHLHPRASEIVIVLKGRVLVGFLTVDNVYYHKVLKVGEVFIIPRALVHFQYNVGHRKAVVLAGFNSQLPGGVLVAGNLFASNPPIPNVILSKALLVNEDVIKTIKSDFIL
ncbi:hypothetical protein IC575_004989 [Cucumis melo]|uniref:Germin-like protein n=3 Tax=Cucumis melo TaxID=3656 RepID=A0A1S3BWX7_CUCME|nr:germin-like protein subfamily T member 1 [Cucumis melo]